MLPEVEGVSLPAAPWGEFSFSEIFDYYDGPRVLLERDNEGRLYLIWWNDLDEDFERWVCLRMSKQRLHAVLSGEMPALRAMEDPEDGYILAVDIDLETYTPARIVKTTTAALPQNTLPHPEATLNIPMPATV